MRTLVDLVPRIAARPHDAALVSSDTATMTVGEFLARVERLAAVLQDSGVRSGIRVGVHHGNGPDAVVAWFATWTAGGTVVPLNPRVATDELARITKTAEIDHVLTAPTGADHVPAGLPMTLHTGDEIRPSTTGAGTQRADSSSRRGRRGGPGAVHLGHDRRTETRAAAARHHRGDAQLGAR